MTGIILAGGSGSRLWPVTQGVSKQLLPVFSKPMVYYPLSTLMLAGIKDILIITTPHDQDSFKRSLGDGSQFGIRLTYATQAEPKGLAQAFLIAEECGFLKDGMECALVLGDNIFYSNGLSKSAKQAARDAYSGNATVFSIPVNDPCRYGIVELDENGKAISIEEKPKEPKSNLCVTGLYFYPGDIIEKAHNVTPSARGELEITSINEMYLNEGRLNVENLGRGSVWMDAGTIDSLAEASNFVEAVEKRSGIMVGCPEEIAYDRKWLSKEKLTEHAQTLSKSDYGKYLLNIVGK